MECLPFDGEMVFLPAIERVIHDGMAVIMEILLSAFGELVTGD